MYKTYVKLNQRIDKTNIEMPVSNDAIEDAGPNNRNDYSFNTITTMNCNFYANDFMKTRNKDNKL